MAVEKCVTSTFLGFYFVDHGTDNKNTEIVLINITNYYSKIELIH